MVIRDDTSTTPPTRTDGFDPAPFTAETLPLIYELLAMLERYDEVQAIAGEVSERFFAAAPTDHLGVLIDYNDAVRTGVDLSWEICQEISDTTHKITIDTAIRGQLETALIALRESDPDTATRAYRRYRLAQGIELAAQLADWATWAREHDHLGQLTDTNVDAPESGSDIIYKTIGHIERTLDAVGTGTTVEYPTTLDTLHSELAALDQR